MKNCPYCWEKIQNSAKKCKWCKERLDEKKLKLPLKKEISKKSKSIADINLPEEWDWLTERQKELLRNRFPISWRRYRLLTFLITPIFLLYARRYGLFILWFIPVVWLIIWIYASINLEKLCYNWSSPNFKKCLKENKYLRDEKDKNYSDEKIEKNIKYPIIMQIAIWLWLFVLIINIWIIMLLPRMHKAQEKAREQSNIQEKTKNHINEIYYNTVVWETLNLSLEWRPVYWKSDAEISIITFLDPEWTFSQKQFNKDKTIQNIIDKDPNVNMIYINNPLFANSLDKAQVINCYYKVNKNDKKFYNFLWQILIYHSEDISKYDQNNINFALWLVDEAYEKVKKCYENWETKHEIQRTQKRIEENWTLGEPMNIVFNHRNWNRDTVPWAYPEEIFELIIRNVKKENFTKYDWNNYYN